MARQPKLSTDEKIANLEYNLAKCKFVRDLFPDVKIASYSYKGKETTYFSSKLVNASFNNYKFNNSKYWLYIECFYEVEFTHNGKTETLRIDSSPRQTKLATLHTDYKTNSEEIHFSKFSTNMKRNKFKEEIFKECQVKIMEFVKFRPKATLDIKNLDKRLKKLLVFS